MHMCVFAKTIGFCVCGWGLGGLQVKELKQRNLLGGELLQVPRGEMVVGLGEEIKRSG